MNTRFCNRGHWAVSWDETDRVLGHVDGTAVQHQKRMSQFYAKEENVFLHGMMNNNDGEELKQLHSHTRFQGKRSFLGLLYSRTHASISRPAPVCWCVREICQCVRSGKAHSSIWPSFQRVKLHRLSQWFSWLPKHIKKTRQEEGFINLRTMKFSVINRSAGNECYGVKDEGQTRNKCLPIATHTSLT